jgi:protein TonB
MGRGKEHMGLLASLALHGIAVAVLCYGPNITPPITPTMHVIPVSMLSLPAPLPAVATATPQTTGSAAAAPTIAKASPPIRKPTPAKTVPEPYPASPSPINPSPANDAHEDTRNTESVTPNTAIAPSPALAQPTDTGPSTPVYEAAYLHNPPPVYPALARRRGEEGKVLLTVHVSAIGGVEQVAVARSSESALLDQAAVTAVQKWRFVPATQNGTPIAAQVMVPVVFRLQNP